MLVNVSGTYANFMGLIQFCESYDFLKRERAALSYKPLFLRYSLFLMYSSSFFLGKGNCSQMLLLGAALVTAAAPWQGKIIFVIL